KDDAARREQIETRNQLDGLVYKVEKDSKEWVDRLQASDKERLDTALAAGKEALRSGDVAAIKTAHEELNLAYSAAGASLYQSAEGTATDAPPSAEAGEAPSGAEEPIEADYEIVDEPPKES